MFLQQVHGICSDVWAEYIVAQLVGAAQQVEILYLVVDNSHVKVAQLLEGICQIGMSLSHMWVQQNAPVIECYALLIVAKLVVYGPDEQQYISLVGIDQVYLQPQRTSHEKKDVETMANAGSLCVVCEEKQCSLESVKMLEMQEMWSEHRGPIS